MAFLDRFVSDVIKKSTGFNARPFVRKVGGKNILLLGGAAVAAALAAEKMSQKREAPAGTAKTPPLPPLPTDLPPLPSTENAAEAEPPRELTYAIVRCLVAGALSDGEMGEDEKRVVEEHLGDSGLSSEQIERVRKDLVFPASPEELAGLVSTPEDREMLYRFGALAVVADKDVSTAESTWLDQLAGALGLDSGRARALRDEIFAAAT